QGIPVGQTYAPARLDVPDAARFGSAVDPIVLARQADPHCAGRVVWAWRNCGLGVLGVRVPEQLGIVMELWVAHHFCDLPGAQWQRVTGAADARRAIEEHRAVGVSDHQGAIGLRHYHLDGCGSFRVCRWCPGSCGDQLRRMCWWW